MTPLDQLYRLVEGKSGYAIYHGDTKILMCVGKKPEQRANVRRATMLLNRSVGITNRALFYDRKITLNELGKQ